MKPPRPAGRDSRSRSSTTIRARRSTGSRRRSASRHASASPGPRARSCTRRLEVGEARGHGRRHDLPRPQEPALARRREHAGREHLRRRHRRALRARARGGRDDRATRSRTRTTATAATARSTWRATCGGSRSASTRTPGTRRSPSTACRRNRAVIVPMLAYADAPAALEFLCRAFGFEQRFRMDMPDGTIGHAELALGGAPRDARQRLARGRARERQRAAGAALPDLLRGGRRGRALRARARPGRDDRDPAGERARRAQLPRARSGRPALDLRLAREASP